jgi:hypothetical protein
MAQAPPVSGLHIGSEQLLRTYRPVISISLKMDYNSIKQKPRPPAMRVVLDTELDTFHSGNCEGIVAMAVRSITLQLPENLYIRLQQTAQATQQSSDEILLH